MESKQKLIEELSQAIQQAGTLTVLHTNAVANRVGLSATEFESMDLINRCQPISAGKLAFKCGLTTGAITGIIDRLERAGFVRRRHDPRDRRRVLLEPIADTEKLQRIHELYQPISEAFEELANQYTEEQLQFLVDIHDKMNTITEKLIADMKTR